jgi:hypothetical protein
LTTASYNEAHGRDVFMVVVPVRVAVVRRVRLQANAPQAVKFYEFGVGVPIDTLDNEPAGVGFSEKRPSDLPLGSLASTANDEV